MVTWQKIPTVLSFGKNGRVCFSSKCETFSGSLEVVYQKMALENKICCNQFAFLVNVKLLVVV